MVDKWGLTCMDSLVMNTLQLLHNMGQVLVSCDGMRLEVRAGSLLIQWMVV